MLFWSNLHKNFRHYIYSGSLFIIILSVSGCSYTVPTVSKRIDTLKKLVNGKNLQKVIIHTKKFNLYSIHKNLSSCKNKTIDLYIEGDGLSWVTIDKPSKNPTPINPMGLKLFLQDFNKCTVYIARPCQYISGSNCKPKYWTSGRFSNEVIKSFNEALDKIKKITKASSFRLFGYSGGGAIATILAAKRDDISILVTIGGNLDIKKWSSEHYITPLYDSLNPANFTQQLSSIKQFHLIGEKDTIVGISVFQSYFKKFKNKNNIRYKVFKGFNHNCCWEKNWGSISKNLKIKNGIDWSH